MLCAWHCTPQNLLPKQEATQGLRQSRLTLKMLAKLNADPGPMWTAPVGKGKAFAFFLGFQHLVLQALECVPDIQLKEYMIMAEVLYETK